MSGRPSTKPTIREVAKLADVSVATVSRVMNDHAAVRVETRERVRRAAQDLAFSVPRRSARARGKQLTVGLLTSDSVGRFSIPVLLGAEDALGAAGRGAVLLCDARGDMIREQHYLQVLLDRKVDGIIVVGQRTEPRPPLVDTGGVPVVYAYAPSSRPQDVSFMPDNVHGANLAVDHLLSLGRTKLAHITGPADWAATIDRVTGMNEALSRAGISPVAHVLYGGDWSARWGRHGAAMLLARRPDVDAIFCGSDQIATGVLDTLREHQRKVPDDVAVVGFDNWDVVATDARVPLTTVDMNLEDLGRAAAQQLFSAIVAEPPSAARLWPCRLVIRQSSAPG